MSNGTNVSGQPAIVNPADAATADVVIAKKAQEQAQLEGAGATPETAAEDNLPEKFKGKTPVDIARAYEELEAKLGQQGQMIGQMQQALSYYDGIARQMAGQPQNQPVPQTPPPSATKFDWEKPEDSVRMAARQEIEGYARQLQMQTASMLAGFARQQAKTSNPAIFNGVENEVNTVIDQGIRSGWLKPESVANPETWIMAAWQVQGAKAAYNATALSGFPRSPNPMAPVGTETPQGFRSPNYQSETIVLTDEQRAMIAKTGQNEKDVIKLMMEERKAGR